VPDTVLPGDLDPGDVIALDGSQDRMLVVAIRLGSGGFVLTVAPLRGGRPGPERQLTLTASTPVRKRGRARLWLSARAARQNLLHEPGPGADRQVQDRQPAGRGQPRPLGVHRPATRLG
jgi:hypothetical protein